MGAVERRPGTGQWVFAGDYAALARALGGYGERVTDPGEIVPAIRRGIAQTQEGTPALLEFITQKELGLSVYPR